MTEERDVQSRLYPPPPEIRERALRGLTPAAVFDEVYGRALESQCGDTDDSQAVELYDGTLGVTQEFVDDHQRMVGQIQWNSNLATIYTNAGNVSGVRWGTGTLVSDNLFLTAGHNFDPDPDGWMVPLVNGTSNRISPQDIALNMHVNFDYQVDQNGNLRTERQFAITELVEYRPGGLDVAVVRLAGEPRRSFGIGWIATGDPPTNDAICIIGHPAGQPKRVEAGSIFGYSGDEIQYGDIDTLPGNSGSAIWHPRTGNIVGVHVEGGCTTGGGFNSGVRISSILKWSPTVQSLTLHAPPILAEHSLKAVDVSGISRDNGTNVHQWEYWGGPNQRFWPAPRGGGPENYSFAADHSMKVLDVSEFSQQDGARLHQWTWNDTPNQRFRVEPVGRGYRRLVAQHSGKVVDVAKFSRGSGAQIYQWTWLNNENQRFRFLAGPIFVQLSGKALDITGFSRERGAPLHQWAYHGDVNQIFRFEPLGDGTYRIVADHSGKVLDVEGGSTANGARVFQWDWHGGRNQRFWVDAVGGGFYRIMAVHSGRVLDVHGISRENGARIVQWDYWGGPNQRFRLFSAPLVAIHSGKAMDVSGSSRANGAAAVQWDLWGWQNQLVYPERLADGTYRLVVDHSRKVLDVEGYSRQNGGRLHQWEWHGGPNQRFRLEPNVTAGEYRIVAVHSGKVLDVEGISNANGARIHQWDWVGGFNQLWRFG